MNIINDPELKAMSEVLNALDGLEASTQKRVVDWVLAKLQSPSTSSTKGAKRGPKPGSKRGTKRGGKSNRTLSSKTSSAKRGLKLGTGSRPKGSSNKGRSPGRPNGSKNKG